MYAKILLMTASILVSGLVYSQDTTTPTDPTTTPIIKTKKKKKKKTAKAATETAAVTTTAAPAVEVKPVEVVKPVEAAKPAEEKLTGSQEALKYLKDHFKASYNGEYYFVRRDVDSANVEDHKIKDFNLMHNPTIIYNPNKDWSVMSTAEFKYTDQPDAQGPAYPNTFYRALFTLTRNSVLNEKDHGVQLDLGIGRRVFNAGVAGLPLGNDRIMATVTKKYGKNTASVFAQYLYNDVKKSSATTWKHSLEVIPSFTWQITEKLSYLFTDDIIFNTPKYSGRQHDISTSHEMNVGYVNYQWNDKINTYYQLKYYHTDGFDQPATGHLNADYMEHYAGLGYAFTSKVTLTGEVGSEIIRAGDGRSFLAKKASYPTFALYLDAAL